MNLLIKNLVLFLLFYGFLSSFSRAKTSYDCSDPAAACVRISGGSVEYLNPLYNTQAMTLGDIFNNDLSVNVVVKDSTGGYDAWDVGKYGAGFIVSTTGYTLPHGLLLGESDGMPTEFFQPNSNDVKNAIFADPVEDKAGMAYIVLDVNGALRISGGQFVNHGETIIEPSGSFVMDGATTPPIAYSDVLTIGASGGARATVTITETVFTFHTIVMENATLDVNGSGSPIGGIDKEIYMNGDASITLSDMNLRYDTVPADPVSPEKVGIDATLDIYISNDNNLIEFDKTSFLWEFMDADTYSADSTSNIYITCDSYCNKNKIDMYIASSHWGVTEFTIEGAATFEIDLDGQAWLDIDEVMTIENSNVVIDSREGVFSFGFYTESAHVTIDENSSFVYSGYGGVSGVIFLDMYLVSEGKFEINLDQEPGEIGGTRLSITTVQDVNFNLHDATFTFSGEVEILDGELYVNATGASYVEFPGARLVTGTEDGRLIINMADDTLVFFDETTIEIDVKINQEVYTDTSKHTLLRFNKVETFLDDDLDYNYNVNVAVKNNDFSVKNFRGLTIVLVQIRNEGPVDDFQYIDEVTAKIEEAGDGLDGIDVGGGDGGDGGDGSVDTSLSVLIGYEGSTGGGGDTGGTGEAGVGFIDYITIGDKGQQYAEFGIWSAGGGGGSTGELVYIRAQDQYGEEAGLLTLTTIENMNGYEVAVVFDNIVLSDTDTEPYRVTLFNLVINNSRTVEQLGQTLNSLNANITLSNVAYSTSILEMSDKKNAGLLLEGQRFATYAEVRNIANDEFGGNYLVFGAFLTLFESQRFRFGASGFFSPYKVHTLYDAEEDNTNIGASFFGAIQIGSNGGALMFDASAMRSTINGLGLQTLTTVENVRQYNYETSSLGASVSYNFGYYFSQRMVVSAFVMKPSSYVETGSDLALHVTTPTYYNAFVGYYSKLINSATIIFEIGAKYYFKEGQIGGTAGFINDPAEQEWAYQYVLLDSPVELSADLSYKILENLEIKGSANVRGSYRNIGVYITYKRSIFVGDGEYEEGYAEAEEEEFEEEEEEEVSFDSIYSGNIGD